MPTHGNFSVALWKRLWYFNNTTFFPIWLKQCIIQCIRLQYIFSVLVVHYNFAEVCVIGEAIFEQAIEGGAVQMWYATLLTEPLEG